MLIIIYSAFIIRAIISSYLIWKAYNNKDFNEDLYNSIPNVFTTIGVLGTFLGIYIGFQNFTQKLIKYRLVLPNYLKVLKGHLLLQ